MIDRDTSTDFSHRGIVEGFYGPPWSQSDRLWWIDRLAELGMNRLVLAPKDDPDHREAWRDPLAETVVARLRELVARGAPQEVAVGMGVSPGGSIRASRASDLRSLVAKFRRYVEIGSRFLVLALDDVPTHLADAGDRATFSSLADAHLALAFAVLEACPEATLWFVPTDYAGTEDSDYLAELGERLPPQVEIGWTGRTVVCPTITAREASRRARVLRRSLLLWDNVPVSDGPMRSVLHLGPYAGREPALREQLSGILLNPMQRARASYPMVASAAGFLRGEDASTAWQSAIRRAGQGAESAFSDFARAHRFSPSTPNDRDRELEAMFEEFRRAVSEQQDLGECGDALEAALRRRAQVRADLDAALADRALLDELRPWIDGHHEETRRMAVAVEAIRLVMGDAPALAKCQGLAIFEGSLTLHPAAGTVSYGPRRAFYPQMISHRDSEACFGTDPALFVGRSLADEFVDFAEEVAFPELGARTASRDSAGDPSASR